MPELRGAVARLGARALLLDGELCVVLPDGRTRFQALQDALAGGARDGIASFAFDLLHLDGEDVAALPLDERRSRLRALVPAGGVVRCADAFEGDGPDVWREACRLGLEGIVSKRRDLADRPGRSAAWQGTGGAEFGFEFVVEVAFGFEFVVEVAFEFEFEFAFGGRGRLRRPRLPSLPRRRSLHRRDEARPRPLLRRGRRGDAAARRGAAPHARPLPDRPRRRVPLHEALEGVGARRRAARAHPGEDEARRVPRRRLARSALLDRADGRRRARLLTTSYALAGREAKILVDYLRNDRTNTSVAAFSTRARPGLPVSVPLAWDELDRRAPPAHDARSVPRRLVALRGAHPWRAYPGARQRLSDAALAAAGARPGARGEARRRPARSG